MEKDRGPAADVEDGTRGEGPGGEHRRRRERRAVQLQPRAHKVQLDPQGAPGDDEPTGLGGEYGSSCGLAPNLGLRRASSVAPLLGSTARCPTRLGSRWAMSVSTTRWDGPAELPFAPGCRVVSSTRARCYRGSRNGDQERSQRSGSAIPMEWSSPWAARSSSSVPR